MNRWQNVVGIILIGTLVGYGCRSGNLGPSRFVTLGARQSTQVLTDLTVRVDSILDSRCPKNVQCIWAGQAEVRATLSVAQDSAVVRLVLAATPADKKRLDSTGVTLNAQTYSVVLRAVNPNPTEIVSTVPKEAVIEVTKR